MNIYYTLLSSSPRTIPFPYDVELRQQRSIRWQQPVHCESLLHKVDAREDEELAVRIALRRSRLDRGGSGSSGSAPSIFTQRHGADDDTGPSHPLSSPKPAHLLRLTSPATAGPHAQASTAYLDVHCATTWQKSTSQILVALHDHVANSTSWILGQTLHIPS